MATIFQCLISMFDLFQYCIVCTYIFSHVDLDPHLTHQKTRLSPGLGTFIQFSGLTEGCWGFCRHMSITTVFQGEALPCNLLGMNSVPCRITDWLNGSKLGKLEFLGFWMIWTCTNIGNIAVNFLDNRYLYSGHPFAKKYQCSSQFGSVDLHQICLTGSASDLVDRGPSPHRCESVRPGNPSILKNHIHPIALYWNAMKCPNTGP